MNEAIFWWVRKKCTHPHLATENWWIDYQKNFSGQTSLVELPESNRTWVIHTCIIDIFWCVYIYICMYVCMYVCMYIHINMDIRYTYIVMSWHSREHRNPFSGLIFFFRSFGRFFGASLQNTTLKHGLCIPLKRMAFVVFSPMFTDSPAFSPCGWARLHHGELSQLMGRWPRWTASSPGRAFGLWWTSKLLMAPGPDAWQILLGVDMWNVMQQKLGENLVWSPQTKRYCRFSKKNISSPQNEEVNSPKMVS